MKKFFKSLFLIFLLIFPQYCFGDFIGGAITGGNITILPGRQFFVATEGSDSNDGRSPAKPWATIAKINASSFNCNDQIFLKDGEQWREQMTIPSSGCAGGRIKFGNYGIGVHPILNASTQIANNNFSFTQNNTGSATPYTQTNNAQLSDGVTRNYRSAFTASASQAHGAYAFVSDSTEGAVIVGASICLQAATNVCASAPVRITFNSGSNGVTIAAGVNTATSDDVSFAISKGAVYLCTIYMTQRGISYRTVGTSYSDANVVDESQIQTPTAGQFNTITTGCLVTSVSGTYVVPVYQVSPPQYAIASLTSSNGGTTAVAVTSTPHELVVGQYVTVSGATPTNYNITAIITTVSNPTTFTYSLVSSTSTPASGTLNFQIPVVTMFESQLFLAKQTSLANITSVGEWFWDSTVNIIYVAGAAGDNPSTNGKLYETGHLAYGIYDNGNSHLDISGIDTIEGYGSADANGIYTVSGMSGVFVTGTDELIHDLASWNNSRHCFSFYTGSTNNHAWNLTLHDCDQTTEVAIYGGSIVNATTGNLLELSSIYKSQIYCNFDGLIVFHGYASNNTAQYIDFNANNVTVPQMLNQFDSLTNNNLVQFSHFRGAGATGAVVISGGTGLRLHADVFEQFTNYSIEFKTGSSLETIDGCTILTPASSFGVLLVSSASNTLLNNILYGEFPISIDVASSSGLISNYNLYFSTNSLYRFSYQSTVYTSLVTYQAAASQEANAVNSDPLFNNAAGGDYSIPSNSPAWNAGTSITGFNTRLAAGAVWPQGVSLINSTMSMGAFSI